MSKAYLRAGTELQMDGQLYQVERKCRDGVWTLRCLTSGRLAERTTAEIYAAYVRGSLAFQEKPLRRISIAASSPLPPIDASAAELSAAKVRLAFVRAMKGLPFTRQTVEEAIDCVWDKLDPKPPRKPGWISVYRWARAFIESGENSMALLPSAQAKGNRESRFAQDVIALCEEVLQTVYLTLERPTLEHATNIACGLVRRENEQLPPSCHLRMPTRKLMRGLVKKIPAYDIHAARFGADAARKKFRTSVRHRVTDRPLQRAEMDHTRMDVFVLDDVHGLPLGRPWLTIITDDYTRCVLGLCLSFEPPSRATVARCLRHAFMPKTDLRREFPDLKNDWNAFGVMSELVLDGGTEFHSEELERICFELNVEQHFSPRQTPWFKGKVERFQGTLNRGVSVCTPGKTFGGIIDKADYDPVKHAVVPLSTLRRVVVRWIVDVYHQKTHSALGCSPARMWEANINEHEVAMLTNPTRFDAIVGGATRRVLSHKGIEFAGLRYNSPEMGDLRRTYGDRLEVDVRIDRSNLGQVVVLHPERKTPYSVPCLRPDYASGLTEWQHNVCKQHAKRQNRSTAEVDAWLDALLEIREIVQRELKQGKRKGTTRERIARWTAADQSAEKRNEPGASVEPLQIVNVPPMKSPASPTGGSENAAAKRKRFVPIIEDRVER